MVLSFSCEIFKVQFETLTFKILKHITETYLVALAGTLSVNKFTLDQFYDSSWTDLGQSSSIIIIK